MLLLIHCVVDDCCEVVLVLVIVGCSCHWLFVGVCCCFIHNVVIIMYLDSAILSADRDGQKRPSSVNIMLPHCRSLPDQLSRGFKQLIVVVLAFAVAADVAVVVVVVVVVVGGGGGGGVAAAAAAKLFSRRQRSRDSAS